MVDASIEARMSAAESAMLVLVRSGAIGACGCCRGAGAGECTRELEEEDSLGGGGGDVLAWRGGRSGLLSGGAGDGPRLRGGGVGIGVGDLTASAVAKTEALLLPLLTLVLVLELELELELLPMARWIKLSTVATALPLSFEAVPLTAWIRVRFFRVVGDSRRRSVREGGGGGGGWSARL
jgi:hypothetical protein